MIFPRTRSRYAGSCSGVKRRQSRRGPSSWASTGVRILPKPPMAMLEFLARAAGAGLVAPNFAPGCRVLGISSHGRTHGRPGVAGESRDRLRHREFILAGSRIDVVRLHERQVLLWLGRRLLHDLDPHELRRHRLAQVQKQRLEQLEGLRLVLVQGIALPETP